MSVANTQKRLLFNAISHSSLSLPTSFRAPSRIRHIHTLSSNWTPFTSSSINSSRWKLLKAVPSQQYNSSIHSNIPPTSIRSRRRFSSTPVSQHGHLTPPKPGEERKVTFIDKEGQSHTFQVSDGDNLLDVAQANDLEMEGACGGSCACSTCHVIVESDHYDQMEEPDDDENDMLDLAFGLTETSRLGCQVKMTKELDGLVVRLPSMTRNLQASDFESK
ncbi:ferredoxin [Zopfia rhizophila CBS 207.26]|uniref:Ferredoxin n=1 Tax=Zopfia rhizophila CBS 207.26 TaxID=1314779 RepID=A0A6A6EMZ7_9PEZI|nr:ferredoxin [Zopfia rhizophila CBS 207.26]